MGQGSALVGVALPAHDELGAGRESADLGAYEVAFAEIGRESGFATARSVTDALLRELIGQDFEIDGNGVPRVKP